MYWIIYLSPNVNGYATNVWKWMINFIPQFMIDAGIKVDPYY